MITWNTRLQNLVSPSTTVAEITAVTDATDNILILNYELHEIFGSSVPPIYEDNSSAYKTLLGGNTKKMRYAMIKAHLVRDFIDAGLLQLSQVPSTSQLADPLTKALNPADFERFTNICSKK